MRALALCAALALAGCTTASAEFSDGTKASFTRVWTSASVKVDEHGMSYTSDPSAAATAATIDTLTQALTVLIVDRAQTGPRSSLPVGFPAMLRLPETGG